MDCYRRFLLRSVLILLRKFKRIELETAGVTMAATHAHQVTLPVPDLYPDRMKEVWLKGEPRQRWLPQGRLYDSWLDPGSTATAVRHMRVTEPLYYNSLVDKYTVKHLAKPTVQQHLYQRGFMARDGTAYPTRREQMEAKKVYRFHEEREALLLKVEAREKERLRRLRRATRAGDITFTRDGIFEAKPCSACNVQHKVAPILSPTDPCPGSWLAKYKQLTLLPEPYRTRRSHKVRGQFPSFVLPHVNSCIQVLVLTTC